MVCKKKKKERHINNKDMLFKALDACKTFVSCILTSLDAVHHSCYTSTEAVMETHILCFDHVLENS